MHKKGGMRWQKRYFVLYQQGTRLAQLAYFRDGKSHEEDARATLELAPDTKVDTLLGRAHAFQVILKGRALKVAADNNEDREMWMTALRDCISTAIAQNMVHFSGTDWFVDSKHLPNSSQGEVVSKKRCSVITIIVHCFKGMSCTVKLVQAHTDLWLRHKMLILARKWPLKKWPMHLKT